MNNIPRADLKELSRMMDADNIPTEGRHICVFHPITLNGHVLQPGWYELDTLKQVSDDPHTRPVL